MTRRSARAMVVAGMLLLGACGAGPDGVPAESGDCDRCTAQLADLRGALDGLDGVASVDRLDYDPDDGPNDEAGLRVDVVRAADADPADLTDRVARTVWQSEVAPLSAVGVNVLDEPGQSMLEGASTGFEFVLDRDDLQQRWGPRGAPPS